MGWVGRKLRRFEDPTLVRGDGQFVADLAGKAKSVCFVRSPIASGRIVHIEKPSGSLVFTAADLVGVKPIEPLLHRFGYVPLKQPILADDKVSFAGQPIAVVVADSPAVAEDLAEAVEVEIEPITALTDLVQATLPGAALTHDHVADNVIVQGELRTEGLDRAFDDAAELVEIDVRSHRQSAMPLETRGGVASYERRTQRITLHASVQMPHMLRTGLADALSMAECDLRVVAPDVGGAFGQKMSLVPEYVLLVWLARRLKADVAWIEDRSENLTASFHARDQRQKARGAFSSDGRLLGLEVDIVSNVGAFSCYPVTSGVEPLMALAEFPGPYKVPAYGARARGILTNTCPMAPYRGVSRPVITFAIERLMNCAATRLGLDPIEIRRRNLVDSFPHKTATGLTLDEASYIEAMDRAVTLVDLPAFRERQAELRKEGRYQGVGFSVFNERTGYGTSAFAARGMEITPGFERADITMTPSGDVEIRTGASPHGQGLNTTLAQIVADELGIEPERIRVIHGDTDRTPYGWGTFASRSLVIAGGAAKLAAQALGERLKLAAARLLQSVAADIRLEGGAALTMGGEASIGLGELARKVYHQSHQLSDVAGFDLTESAAYDPDGTFSNACHAAIVEVDPETGHVQIDRFIVVEDAGRLINPMIADGQIHGGVAQGIANALFEEVIYAENGTVLTGSLADYTPPTTAEIPAIEIEHLITTSDASITEAKGLGEGGAIGAPAAVVNAICDALSPFGVELFELPATPERVREAIRDREAGRR
ncbi:MAG: xanthine dehydrogenase family protein molybdopterin-binding subunit [Geminicoccaceae bacterium]